MIDVATVLLRLFALCFFLILLSTWLHEGAHYVVSRIQTENVSLEYKAYIFPTSTNIPNLSEISKAGLQLIALAPQAILLSYVIAYFLIFDLPVEGIQGWVIGGPYGQMIPGMIFISAFAAGVVISPADLLAVFCQDMFRNWEQHDLDEYSHIELTRVLFNCLRQ